MKIAISAKNDKLDENLDQRFGRASGFIIYDTDNDSFEYMNNEQNMNASQGAGIQAAQNVVDKDVEAIITGYCGPKAYKVLAAADVKIYTSEPATIKDVIEKFKNNELQEQAPEEDM